MLKFKIYMLKEYIMFARYNLKFILVLVLSVAILLNGMPVNIAAAQDNLFSEVKGKLVGISDKERDTLQKLLSQSQKVDEAKKKVEETAVDIEKANDRIEILKKKIEDDEVASNKEKESLKKVLQYYQRMGPGSFLEIVLESDSLSDFLMRINTLRDLTRNTEKIMDKIEKDKEKQSQEKSKLSEELALVQDKQRLQEKALAEENKLKEDMEKYLASLEDERGRYQEYLDNLQKAWEALKLYFPTVSGEFTSFIKKVSLPEDALKFSFDLFSVIVSMEDKTINNLIAGNSTLSNMIFTFKPGKAIIEIKDKNLTLEGKFEIIDGHSLKFITEEGTFFGIKLDANALAELMKDNSLEINLESILERNKLKAVDIMDGYLSLTL